MPGYDPLFERAVAVVLAHEGGLVDDPADPGGLTHYGISLRAHPDLGAERIRALTREEAIRLYFERYWSQAPYGKLPEPLAVKTFDLCVNFGPSGGVRILQRALRSLGHGIEADGVLGPQTLAAARRCDVEACLREMRVEAAMSYCGQARREPKKERFLRGWLRRAIS